MAKNTVLVVDDEPNILSSVRRALELEGYGVVVAGSASAGLARVADREIDLVLLDVVMPEMNGIEVLRALRHSEGHPVVVMMSGNATVEIAVEATKLGAYDFLEKPLSSEKLLLTVGNALGHARLRREHAALVKNNEMIGSSLALREVLDRITKTAPTQGRVLITGENGTGKELVARAIHDASDRKDGPFVRVNCAAIPSELIESELFGHEKGAFTGATRERRGKFELADGGTLFLDEIGDMHPNAQAKVLRVLQENELERVGGSRTLSVDVRVLCATNKDLQREIEGGRFREDLFYRLNVVPITVPPLRARRGDIPELANSFLVEACATNGRRAKTIDARAMSILVAYSWPGNVRELRNMIERLVILTGECSEITTADVEAALPGVAAASTSYRPDVPLKELLNAAERDLILSALAHCEHHISNTARRLGLERSHLYKKMKAHGIDPRARDESS